MGGVGCPNPSPNWHRSHPGGVPRSQRGGPFRNSLEPGADGEGGAGGGGGREGGKGQLDVPSPLVPSPLIGRRWRAERCPSGVPLVCHAPGAPGAADRHRRPRGHRRTPLSRNGPGGNRTATAGGGNGPKESEGTAGGGGGTHWDASVGVAPGRIGAHWGALGRTGVVMGGTPMGWQQDGDTAVESPRGGDATMGSPRGSGGCCGVAVE